jgi:acyl carrier protein
MNEAEIRQAFLEELIKIAPDIDAASVGPDDHLQNDLEIDSMDFLNLIAALHKRLGVDIPEAHYSRITTLNLATAYLVERFA